MRTRYTFLLSLVLFFIGTLIYLNVEEQGDLNAMSMYFVVFLPVILFSATADSVYLFYLTGIHKHLLKILLAIVPVLICLLLSFRQQLTVTGLDGNLVFVARVATFVFAVTNGIWIYSLVRQRSKQNPG